MSGCSKENEQEKGITGRWGSTCQVQQRESKYKKFSVKKKKNRRFFLLKKLFKNLFSAALG